MREPDGTRANLNGTILKPAPRRGTPLTHVAICLIALAGAAQSAPALSCTGQIHVIDGDTVEACGVRWRLDGIDAPEIGQARCPAERERGIRGAARLMDLLRDQGGHIVPTMSRRSTVSSGGFGRKLGRLMFTDGAAWSEIAIAEGHAVAWTYRTTPVRPDWCSAAS